MAKLVGWMAKLDGWMAKIVREMDGSVGSAPPCHGKLSGFESRHQEQFF
jgi:hypothetical protein